MRDDHPEDAHVTVVVMTRNRWPDLRSSLPRHQAPVILVDNGSTDGTPAKVRAHFPQVEVIALPKNLGAVARNIGVSRARTPYVAFADDDSWWGTGSLEQAAHLMDSHPRVGLLAAKMLVGVQNRPDWICHAMETSPLPAESDLPGPSILGFLACGAVLRRSAFLAAGGFDDVIFFAGEEERLALDLAAAGWGLAYTPTVVAHHHPSKVRDSASRDVRAERNRLLTVLMRRPWPVVASSGWRALTSGRTGRQAVLRALPKVPAALRSRRRLPLHVEQARRLLQHHQPVAEPPPVAPAARVATSADAIVQASGGASGSGVRALPAYDVESHTITDHDGIRAWVEQHDGVPARVAGTEGDGGTGVLRIDFPGGAGEDQLEHISWDDWFATFDDRGLAFLYQEEKASGEDSTFLQAGQ